MVTLSEKFKEVKKSSNNEHYSTVSVRASTEIASMVDTVSIVTKEAVMNMFTSDLSVYLAEYLLKDSRNIELIKQVLNEEYKDHDPHDEIETLTVGSCVEVLEKKGAMDLKVKLNFVFK